MSGPGTLERFGQEVALIFQPLETRFDGDNAVAMLAELGLQAPADLVAAPALTDALGQTAGTITALPEMVRELVDAINADDDAVIVSAGIALIDKIGSAVEGIARVASVLDSLATSLGGLTPAQRDELRAFASAFAERLLARLLVEFIERRYNHVFVVFVVGGAIEIIDVGAGPSGSLQAAHQLKLVHFNRALRLFTDPLGLLRDVYKWGAADFDGIALFRAIKLVLEKTVGIEADVLQPTGMPATLEALVFSATVDPSGPTPGLEVSVRQGGDANVTDSFAQDDWVIDVAMQAHAVADMELTLKPPLDVRVQLATGSLDTAFSANLQRVATAPPLVIFGETGGSRLEVKNLTASTAFSGHWDSGGASVSAMPSLRAAIAGGKLVITGNGGDSLIAEALRGVDIEAPFDLGVSWSADRGLQFTGSAGLTIDIAAHAQLGPIAVDEVFLNVGFADGGLHMDLAVTIGTTLGPLVAEIERLGVRALVSFPPRGGNVGPAQLDIAFLPPTGVGLSLETSAVTLAGFLSIDEAAHRYAGAVAIRIVDSFELSAIGIITTRFPDGSEGFSLLFIIDTVFPEPILLGYNFYLAGVGGMLGLHRTTDLDRMRTGLRDGAAQNILFPTDVVANMTAIVGQLGSFFPPKRDQFVVGPTALITWNSPPLVTIQLGLIIEFANPVRLAVLGVMRAAVPDESDPVVDIKVAFLGQIDFELGMLSFDASIYDSHIGRGDFRFSFEGDIAVRVSWGEQKDVLYSVGGFHPAYTVPAYLRVPALRRISLSLLKDNPRLRLSAYFALTTNTVQFGAELDFYFRVSGFSVVGDFGFDVLFQRSPFHFVASVHARLAVRAGSTDLLSLTLAFELQGTTPWHATGKASFGILFFSVTVHFDKTWGDLLDLVAPEVAVLAAVLDEFRRDEHWIGTLSASASQIAQIFPGAQAASGLLVDPASVLEISQCLVPLGAELNLFNNARPSDISSVDVHEVRIAGRGVDAGTLHDVSEEFAPAAFRELSDEDKLAAASYEPMKGGIAAREDEALTTDYLIGRPVTYERIVDDGTPGTPPVRSRALGNVALFAPLIRGGAVGSSALSRRAAVRRQRGAVLDVSADEETFTVVSTDNLRAVDPQGRTLSRSQAQARLKTLIAAGRSAEEIDIIPAYRAAS